MQVLQQNLRREHETRKELSRPHRSEDPPPHFPGVRRQKRAEELKMEGEMRLRYGIHRHGIGSQERDDKILRLFKDREQQEKTSTLFF